MVLVVAREFGRKTEEKICSREGERDPVNLLRGNAEREKELRERERERERDRKDSANNKSKEEYVRQMDG